MNSYKMIASVIATVAMLLIPSAVSASPLDPARVPADAKWVIHLDLEAISGTTLAEQVRQKRAPMARYVRQWFQNRYGIDPREDLDALTMFSDTYESHTGTMILKAGYDRKKVRSELQNKPNVQTHAWQNHTLYTVLPEDQKPGKPMVIVLLDDQTAIFASSAGRAKAAVKLVQGDSPSLEGKDSKLLKEHRAEAMVYGAAIDLKQIAQREGIFPILRQHEHIHLSVSEEDGKVLRKLTLVAQSDDVAEQMKTTLEGLVAFSKVWAADSENLKQMAEDAEIRIDGQVVKFEGRHDSETVLNALGEVRERIQQRIEAARN